MHASATTGVHHQSIDWSPDHRQFTRRPLGEKAWAFSRHRNILLMHDHLARRVFHAGLDGEYHILDDHRAVAEAIRRRLGELKAQAMAKPSDIVADGAGILDDLRHGAPHIIGPGTGHRSGNTN